MFRKRLFGAVALLGLMMIGPSTADAGWRRAYRSGYYAPNYGYGYYGPRPVYRRSYYVAPVVNYGYAPGYYGAYYAPTYYGPAVTVQTPIGGGYAW